MTGKTFDFGRLPHHIATQILEDLSFEELYIVEQTCHALRDLVKANHFLKYTSPNTETRHVNPLAHGFYGVHQGWDVIEWTFYDPPEEATLVCDTRMFYKLVDTTMATDSAVYPPTSKLSIDLHHDTKIEVVGQGNDAAITIMDVMRAMATHYQSLSPYRWNDIYASDTEHDPDYVEDPGRMEFVTYADLLSDHCYFEGLEWIEGTRFKTTIVE